MLRILAALLMMVSPAMAWEVTSNRLCAIEHDGKNAYVRVTYDPAASEYAIAITPVESWTKAPTFALRFDGPRANVITTNRHIMSEDGATVTVIDSGFGNVLDGLEYNFVAAALMGSRIVVLSLVDAAPAVRDFRACVSALDI